MVECVQTLKACVSETSHPMLLPFLILSEEISYKEDLRQRECRDWLRRIEHAVGQHAGRRKILASDQTMPLDIISHDINDCYAKALWRAPLAYVRLIESFLETMELFTQHIPTTGSISTKIQKIHDSFVPALRRYKAKQQGLETFANTTLQRLENQRSLASYISSKRDSSAMKTIAILGIVFLPGTFVAAVSPSFWIYWIITVPVTLIILGLWYLWEKQRDGRFVRERNEREETDYLVSEIDLEEYYLQPLQRARPLADYE
ncbi:hypothetical protein BGAL_0113g00050 [Botrytis galanthina]|uniref:Uncharacterized protein n=1 Tax=Botrytis galanthina TaxID=278940 RepID=A0A4S8R1X1_9HELO|nr:hypothetical protein BGAL_0113g00050 [Botrytis galanthina]